MTSILYSCSDITQFSYLLIQIILFKCINSSGVQPYKLGKVEGRLVLLLQYLYLMEMATASSLLGNGDFAISC